MIYPPTEFNNTNVKVEEARREDRQADHTSFGFDLNKGRSDFVADTSKFSKAETNNINYRDPSDTKADKLVVNDIDYSYWESSFSRPYIAHNVRLFIRELYKNFEDWKNNGTNESYSQISQIKQLLNKYSSYMDQQGETRILAGTLGLLFKDNNWEKITPAKLKLITAELKRFDDGEVTWDSMQGFAKQLWSNEVIPS